MSPVELINPSDVPAAVLEEVAALIRTCETVQTETLMDLLERAYKIALRREGKKLIGTATIKNPYPQYRQGLIRKSGFKGLAGIQREFGYVCVGKNFRKSGVGIEISETLLNWCKDPLYATTLTGNVGMQNILRKFSFSKVGGEWDSENNSGKLLELWVRQ